MLNILQKLLGTENARILKRLSPVVEQINRLEPEMQKLSDAQLPQKTQELRERLAKRLAGESFVRPGSPEWYDVSFEERANLRKQRRAIQQRALDELLPEAFALVRETARRTVAMRHFDSQLLGGLVLHEGKIAEMATGEGKTLVATLPAYLNALSGRGVHVVTVNDYLARRDARWMGPIYHALGLSVGSIQGVDPAERQLGDQPLSFIYDPSFTQGSDRFIHLRPVQRGEAYRADITYGQNNEFGFDYLRDNMRVRLEELVQREFHYAIVDEVDSILIDEARTPLIISGPAEDSTDLYARINQVVRKLAKEGDFELDEKQKAVSLTEQGIHHAEELLGVENLYEESHMRLVHHVHQALRAHHMFKRDVDYMIKDDEVLIVDEFTGRLMPGRRWSDGLHQAIEAKEGVRIREENQTLATVTFQNYFRMYDKLAGMTGTALTEAPEFTKIYELDVVTVPTNRPMARVTYPDVVFKTEQEKFLASVQEIAALHRKGQPLLVGTLSIEKSERLSRMLREPGPIVKRLGAVSQWAAQELAKETLPDDLRQAISALVTRPAMIHADEAAAVLERLKAQAPKSAMVYRLEDIVRLLRTADAVKAGIPHNVLNAKYHEHEARIVAQAGRFGAVTIATNMAGRGTDILLGGNPQFLAEDAIREREAAGEQLTEDAKQAVVAEFKRQADAEHDKVIAAGGLEVIGTERHEARRIDNQLRGRAGRQGDPGSSRFYLSLEDDLMRIFGSDRIAKLMDMKWFQWEEGLPIEHPWVTRSIETAQRRVEGENFEARKHLIEYDNVMNRQREVIYEQRRRFLEAVKLDAFVEELIDDVAEELAEAAAPEGAQRDAWDLATLRTTLTRQFGLEQPPELESVTSREALIEPIAESLLRAYHAKEAAIGPESMRQLERNLLLAVVDAKWKDHLYMMDALRDGINLRAYGQRDPLVEYQHEGYAMFRDMIASIKREALSLLLRIQPRPEAQPVSVFATTPHKEVHEAVTSTLAERFPSMSAEGSRLEAEGTTPAMPFGLTPHPASRTPAPGPQSVSQRVGPKIGRNDPCHCGSGLKFKKCHGK